MSTLMETLYNQVPLVRILYSSYSFIQPFGTACNYHGCRFLGKEAERIALSLLNMLTKLRFQQQSIQFDHLKLEEI